MNKDKVETGTILEKLPNGKIKWTTGEKTMYSDERFREHWLNSKGLSQFKLNKKNG